jgi:hypothetical protein
MSSAGKFFSRERREDPAVTSYKDMLAFVQRVYDLTGQPDLKVMIDAAHQQLGRLPRSLTPERSASRANADKEQISFPKPVHQ